jgi:hypothetical protein
MLRVVEHQQRLFRPQIIEKLEAGIDLALKDETQGVGDGWNQKGRGIECGQRNKAGPVGEAVLMPGSGLARQPGLADATRAVCGVGGTGRLTRGAEGLCSGIG